MNIAVKQILWQKKFNDEYAIVNNSDGWFKTDFIIGNQMTLEVCFMKTTSSASGNCFVGGYNFINDYSDYRFFLYSNVIIYDIGRHGTSGTSGARYGSNAIVQNQWYTAKGPILLNGNTVCMLNDQIIQPEVGTASANADGNFNVNASELSFFKNNSGSNNYEKAAIRFVNVYQYGTDNLLASFFPNKNGQFVDIINHKTYDPAGGSIQVVKWKDL